MLLSTSIFFYTTKKKKKSDKAHFYYPIFSLFIMQPITFLFIIFTVLLSLNHFVQSVPVLVTRSDNKKSEPPKTLKYATEKKCSADITCGFHCLFKESYLFGKCNKESKKCICTAPLFQNIEEKPRIIVVPAHTNSKDGNQNPSPNNGDRSKNQSQKA